jgi:putrescine aminotransferase
MNKQRVKEVYRKHFNASMAALFEAADCPVEQQAEGNYLIDADGKRYLDFCCGYGVFAIGHGNATVKNALLGLLHSGAVGSDYFVSQPELALAACLEGLLPGDLSHCFMARSGSEANEIALRLAIAARPGRTRFVAVINSYHGKSLGVLGLMGQAHLRHGFGDLLPGVDFVEFGNLEAMRVAVTGQTCAVFLEPVLGGGFITLPPEGYLQGVQEICNSQGAVLVLDEVQTGFGRTGALFAFTEAGILPDIVVLSKGITGGMMPLAVAVARESLVKDLPADGSLDDLSLGWPTGALGLSCVAGKAAIDYILRHNIPAHVAQVGAELQSKLQGTMERYPHLLVEIPGKGLMLGAKMRNNILENALWLQLLGVVAGFSTNHVAKNPSLRLCPVLTLTAQEADTFAAMFEEAINEIAAKPMLLYDFANKAVKYQYYMPGFLRKLGAKILS